MIRFTTLLCLGVSLAALSACDLDVTDLNNPPIDDLTTNPTRENVNAAVVGLIIGQRGNVAAANGFVTQLGILGREAYNFDGADPRYVGELLGGPLQKGSPFGGNFWGGQYANLKLAALVLAGAETAAGYSAMERAAVRGFTHTIMALDLLQVIVTPTAPGVIAVTDDINMLSPIVSKDIVYTEINRLLDAGANELGMAGLTFPFKLPSGYAGFTTPANFLKFNRALRARVAVYTKDSRRRSPRSAPRSWMSRVPSPWGCTWTTAPAPATSPTRCRSTRSRARTSPIRRWRPGRSSRWTA